MSRPGAHLRASLRLLLLAPWTLVCWLGYEAERLVRWCLRARPRSHEPIFRVWARFTLGIIGVRLDVAGERPRDPYLLVSNHLGYLDIVVYAALTGASFLSKSEVRRWPVVGFFSRRLRTLFVDRDRPRDAVRAMHELSERLGDGRRVIIFPEATSSPGAEVLGFHAPLFESAVRATVPVACAAIVYDTGQRQAPASEVVCWWGDMTFADHVWGLLGLPGVTARVRFGEVLRRPGDRRELARAARESVMRAHRRLGEGAPDGPQASDR